MNLLESKQQLEAIGTLVEKMPKQAGEFLENMAAFRKLVAQCKGIPGIQGLIQHVERNQAFQSAQDRMKVSDDLRRDLVSSADALGSYLNAVKAFLSAIGVAPASETDVYVGLTSARDLQSVTNQLSMFKKVLEQTILDPKIGGKMEVIAVDRGSIWIQLCLGSVTAVAFVGSVAWAAAVVYKKIQEARLVGEHVRSLEIKNEALEQIQEGQKKLIKCVIAAEAKHLSKETFGDEENQERLERTKHAIELMQELIEKGAEVHPALMVPEQVKNLFPDFVKLDRVESRIKQLTEKAGT